MNLDEGHSIKSGSSDWYTVVYRSFLFGEGLSMGAKIVWIALKMFIGPNCAHPFPGKKALQKKLGISKGLLDRKLKELEQLGYLTVHHRRGDDFKHLSNEYTLFEKPWVYPRSTIDLGGGSKIDLSSVHNGPTLGPKQTPKYYPDKEEPMKDNPKEGIEQETKAERLARVDAVIAALKSSLHQIFRRKPNEPWMREEHALYDVAVRPCVLDELKEIEALYQNPTGRYPSMTARKLLEDWTDNLDKARRAPNGNNTAPSRNEGTHNTGNGAMYQQMAERQKEERRLARSRNL